MFHKEGQKSTFIIVAIINLFFNLVLDNPFVSKIIGLSSLVILLLILQFFRNPKRLTQLNDSLIISPVDGKVVAIEKVYEKEYFKDDRIQVSIFMSPLNVHVTRYANGGKFNLVNTTQGNILWHGIQNLS